MLSDKTKLKMIFINRSLETPLLITTHGCVEKEYMLLVRKIPIRSGCCNSFRLCFYVQMTNTIVQRQQISQYICKVCECFLHVEHACVCVSV